MIDKISDFNGLEEHVKSCGLPFKEAVIDYYRVLGERLGFTVRLNASVIKYGVNLGKLSAIWVEPNIIFSCEFGSLEEVLKHFWRILEHQPEKAVLILSSGSQCKPEHAKKIIENSHTLVNIRESVIILDISEKKVVYPED